MHACSYISGDFNFFSVAASQIFIYVTILNYTPYFDTHFTPPNYYSALPMVVSAQMVATYLPIKPCLYSVLEEDSLYKVIAITVCVVLPIL